MTPGDSMALPMNATPPNIRCGPATRARSGVPTPFCSETTAVAGPRRGRIASAAEALSQSLTQTMTAVHRADLAGIAGGRGRVDQRAAQGGALDAQPPAWRIASRCRPRAMNVTSQPAAAMRPPK